MAALIVVYAAVLSLQLPATAIPSSSTTSVVEAITTEPVANVRPTSMVKSSSIFMESGLLDET
jgi:hypothetical protein